MPVKEGNLEVLVANSREYAEVSRHIREESSLWCIYLYYPLKDAKVVIEVIWLRYLGPNLWDSLPRE